MASQNKQIDIQSCAVFEFQHFLEKIKIEVPPSTNLVAYQDVLKRDPGMFSSWSASTVLLTKDNFVHIYNKNYSLSQIQKREVDLSNPLFSINLNNISNVDSKGKKDLKIEIQQFKANSDSPFVKDITKEVKKMQIKSQEYLQTCQMPKFPQKLVLKAITAEQFDQWESIFNQFNKNYGKVF